MDQARALQLVSELRYKPDWTITAQPSGATHIYIQADYQAPDSSKQYAPDYKVKTTVHSIGTINLDLVGSDLDLFRQVLNFLIETETHEAREFLRHTPSWDAPFHPHEEAGEMAWQITKLDHRAGLPGFEFPRAFIE